MDEQLPDSKILRRTYSYVGVCYTVLLIVSTIAQLATAWMPYWIGGAQNALSQTPWWTWVCMTLPLYAVAMPLCYLMMRRLPAEAPEKHPLSARQILALIPICVCVMYAGNLVGSLLSLLLSGGEAQNAVAELAMDNHPLKFVMMVIAAPVFEELICRKVLLDRVKQYGELLSAVMSGAIFGLLHQNFFQFFYAFGLGFVFSWIYLRCGRIVVSMLFHMGINFLGAVVAPAVVSLVDLEALEALNIATVTAEQLIQILPGYLLLLAYSFMMIALSVTGLIVFLYNRKHLTWQPTAWDLPLKTTLKPSLLNIGMIVYILSCAAMFVFSLVAS